MRLSVSIVLVAALFLSLAPTGSAAPQRRVRELAEQLQRGSLKGRVQAAEQLAKFGRKSARASSQLVAALKSDEEELSDAAGAALVSIGPKGLSAILNELEDDQATKTGRGRLFQGAIAFGAKGRAALSRWAAGPKASKQGIAQLLSLGDLALVAGAMERQPNRGWLLELLARKRAVGGVDREQVLAELARVGDAKGLMERAWFGLGEKHVSAVIEELRTASPSELKFLLTEIAEAGPVMAGVAPALMEAVLDVQQPYRRAFLWALAALGNSGEPAEFAGLQYDPKKLFALGSADLPRDASQLTPQEITVALSLCGGSRIQVDGLSGNFKPRMGGRPGGQRARAEKSRPELHPSVGAIWLGAPRWHTLVFGKESFLAPVKLVNIVIPTFVDANDRWGPSLAPSLESVLPSLRKLAANAADPEHTFALRVMLEWGVPDQAVLQHAAEHLRTSRIALPDRAPALLWRYRDRLAEVKPALLRGFRGKDNSREHMLLLASLGDEELNAELVRTIVGAGGAEEMLVRVLLSMGQDQLQLAAPWIETRFLEADYIVAPLVVRLGEDAVEIVAEALESPLLDLRMVAVSVARELGAPAASLLPKLKALNETEVRAQAMVREGIRVLERSSR